MVSDGFSSGLRRPGSGGVGLLGIMRVVVGLMLAPLAVAAEYESVGFERLAGFRFEPPPPDLEAEAARQRGVEQIPEEIRALDGRKTLVTGYMLPVRIEAGRVLEFLLVKDPSMCCYGVVPNMNEWVVVKMKSGGVAPVMDIPVSFYGELKVGPQFENGYMVGIYELAGERMARTES